MSIPAHTSHTPWEPDYQGLLDSWPELATLESRLSFELKETKHYRDARAFIEHECLLQGVKVDAQTTTARRPTTFYVLSGPVFGVVLVMAKFVKRFSDPEMDAKAVELFDSALTAIRAQRAAS